MSGTVGRGRVFEPMSTEEADAYMKEVWVDVTEKKKVVHNNKPDIHRCCKVLSGMRLQGIYNTFYTLGLAPVTINGMTDDGRLAGCVKAWLYGYDGSVKPTWENLRNALRDNKEYHIANKVDVLCGERVVPY